jgi:quinoprotein relay system zinc metallohydrolase 2
MGFIVGESGVAVIDTGGSRVAGERLRATIRRHTDLPIRYVINTHMHPDHVFGNAAFRAPGTIFAGHRKLARALQARGTYYLEANRPLLGDALIGGVEIVLPQLAIDGTQELDLGSRTLVVTAHATAHTDNDLTVFDVSTATLFAGDLLFSQHTPALDGSIAGWLSEMDELKSLPAERVVPGHGPASLPWPSGMDDQFRYLNRITGEVRAFIAAGRPLNEAMEQIGRDEAGKWLLFDEFNARNIAAAFAELEWE